MVVPDVKTLGLLVARVTWPAATRAMKIVRYLGGITA